MSIEDLHVANVDAKREVGEKIDPTDVIDINAVSVDDFKDIQDAEVIEQEPQQQTEEHK